MQVIGQENDDSNLDESTSGDDDEDIASMTQTNQNTQNTQNNKSNRYSQNIESYDIASSGDDLSPSLTQQLKYQCDKETVKKGKRSKKRRRKTKTRTSPIKPNPPNRSNRMGNRNRGKVHDIRNLTGSSDIQILSNNRNSKLTQRSGNNNSKRRRKATKYDA